MASSLHTSILDSLSKLWPLLILLLFALLYLHHLDHFTSSFLCSHSPLPIPARSPSDASHASSPLPYSTALSLVHYATSKITPQQTAAEIMITVNILSRRGPCNFLVYGLGFDSPLWHALNHGGRTVFLEEDPNWIATMAKAHPYLESYAMNYTTKLSNADKVLAYARSHRDICSPDVLNLRESKCPLAIKTFPQQIYDVKWDVIMIDAPKGYFAEAPGRMGAIFTSGVMAMSKRKGMEKTDILLHDTDRRIEKVFAAEFLCRKNLVQAAGKLWHFSVPGISTSRGASVKSFCA